MAKSNHKVKVINSVDNSTIKVIYTPPVSIRGFDNYRYNELLYAGFVNASGENVIYVDPTLNTELEIEENV